MTPKEVWQYFKYMTVFAVGMLVCLLLFFLTNEPLFQWIGFGFIAGGIGIMIKFAFKIRKMAKGDFGDNEKPWRSWR